VSPSFVPRYRWALDFDPAGEAWAFFYVGIGNPAFYTLQSETLAGLLAVLPWRGSWEPAAEWRAELRRQRSDP
jgi:hypothetical protein